MSCADGRMSSPAADERWNARVGMQVVNRLSGRMATILSVRMVTQRRKGNQVQVVRVFLAVSGGVISTSPEGLWQKWRPHAVPVLETPVSDVVEG